MVGSPSVVIRDVAEKCSLLDTCASIDHLEVKMSSKQRLNNRICLGTGRGYGSRDGPYEAARRQSHAHLFSHPGGESAPEPCAGE